MTRVGGVGASALAVLAVVIGAGLALTGCSSPAPTGKAAVASTDPVRVPTGWSTHVYGRAAISVPPTWTVVLDANCPSATQVGTLFLGGPWDPGLFCPAALSSGPSVTVTNLGMPGIGTGPAQQNDCNPTTVNHLRVFVGPCERTRNAGGLTTWTIPALGSQVVATTSGGGTAGSPTGTVVDKVLHTIRRATPAETVTRSPLSLRVTLDHTTVKAGTSIKGEVTLANTTTKDITVETCAVDGWLDVGLTGHGVTFAPAHIQIACLPTVQLPPGTTRVPVTVITSYNGCAPPGASIPSQAVPQCTATGPPPLPVGRYRVAVVTTGLPPELSGPNDLTVTLTHWGSTGGVTAGSARRGSQNLYQVRDDPLSRARRWLPCHPPFQR